MLVHGHISGIFIAWSVPGTYATRPKTCDCGCGPDGLHPSARAGGRDVAAGGRGDRSSRRGAGASRVDRSRRGHLRRPRSSRGRRWDRRGADRCSLDSSSRAGGRLCATRAADPVREALWHHHVGDRRGRRGRHCGRGAVAGGVLAPVRARSWPAFAVASSTGRWERSRWCRAGSGTPIPPAPSSGVQAVGSWSTWACMSSTRSGG